MPNGVSTRPLISPGARFHATLSNWGTNRPRGPGGRYPPSRALPGSCDTCDATWANGAPPFTVATAFCACFRAAAFSSGVAVADERTSRCWKIRTSPAL